MKSNECPKEAIVNELKFQWVKCVKLNIDFSYYESRAPVQNFRIRIFEFSSDSLSYLNKTSHLITPIREELVKQRHRQPIQAHFLCKVLTAIKNVQKIITGFKFILHMKINPLS